jgi:hypothetical protein
MAKLISMYLQLFAVRAPCLKMAEIVFIFFSFSYYGTGTPGSNNNQKVRKG